MINCSCSSRCLVYPGSPLSEDGQALIVLQRHVDQHGQTTRALFLDIVVRCMVQDTDDSLSIVQEIF